MVYSDVIAFLEANCEEKFGRFSAKLTPTADKIYGVRLPILRAFAKNLDISADRLLAADKRSLEEKMITGFKIGYENAPLDVFIARVEKFAEQIDNWAVCDSACATFKIIARHRDEFLPTVDKLLKGGEFSKRLALVILLDHYVYAEYAEYIFRAVDGVGDCGYYVKMAAAWLLSVCYVKIKDLTEEYLFSGRPDREILNKAISKIADSYRVSDDDKIKLKKRRANS